MKRSTLFIAAACLLPLAYLFIAFAASLDSGQGYRMAASLDDAYIYFQYAREFAQGHFFSYQAGDAPSTGVTGLSYLFLLAALAKAGVQGAQAAWLIGSAAWVASLYFLLRLRERLFPSLGPWSLLALLFSLGPFCAAYFNGLETGLFLMLVFACMDAFSDESAPAERWFFLILLAWTRPEGQVAALAFAFWELALERPRPWKAAFVALAFCAGPSLLVHGLTGSWVLDSVRAKTTSFGETNVFETLRAASSFGIGAIKGLWMGSYGPTENVGFVGDGAGGNPVSPHFPPLMLLLALFGALGAPRSKAWLALLCWAFGGLLLQAWNLPVGWHQHRYLLAFSPFLILGAARGLHVLDARWRNAWLALALAFGVFSAPWALMKNYENAKNYRGYHGAAAAWMKENMPPDAVVAVVDAGILCYESGLRIADMPGITDHALSLAAKKAADQGSLPLFKELASRPLALRPGFAALHEGREDFNPANWVKTGILTEIHRIQPDPSKSLVIYRWNWDRVPPLN